MAGRTAQERFADFLNILARQIDDQLGAADAAGIEWEEVQECLKHPVNKAGYDKLMARRLVAVEDAHFKLARLGKSEKATTLWLQKNDPTYAEDEPSPTEDTGDEWLAKMSEKPS